LNKEVEVLLSNDSSYPLKQQYESAQALPERMWTHHYRTEVVHLQDASTHITAMMRAIRLPVIAGSAPDRKSVLVASKDFF